MITIIHFDELTDEHSELYANMFKPTQHSDCIYFQNLVYNFVCSYFYRSLIEYTN